ncbi:MAG: DUF1727 domain-containing protein [Oscillospiraceae bacterium]|nr:DUF1727 domain-containing protein [Oscillospiraceae bacterium]
MKQLRYILTAIFAKLCCIGMKLLHRQASFLPGKIAIKLCPDFLSRTGRPKTVIAVTGTNGKTTVSNLIAGILRTNGFNVINNSAGSNVDAGIASALIDNSNLFGKPHSDIAVLEVDERSSLRIYPHIKPDYIVCNNIMRDSVKRNANTEFISYIISSAIPENTTLVLNADDIICSALGSPANRRLYFGVEHMFGTECFDVGREIKDISYCPVCGAELVYDYTRYNHIGRVHCSACGFKNPVPDYTVTAVDTECRTLTVSHGGKEFRLRLLNDNISNIYNTAAAAAVCTELGLSPEQIESGLHGVKIVASRFDREECCGKPITLQLAKSQNPIACSRAIDYARKSVGRNKAVIVIIDDIHENCGNTENISWIYDCSYAPLADDTIGQVIFGGPRSADHILRAMIDGVDVSGFKTTDDIYKTVELLDAENCDAVFIMYDLYLVSAARKVLEAVKAKIEEAQAK